MSSKKKAIEAAIGSINFITDASGCYLISPKAAGLCRPILELLWEQARITGLREAARLWICSPESCREQAAKLAKKAKKRGLSEAPT